MGGSGEEEGVKQVLEAESHQLGAEVGGKGYRQEQYEESPAPLLHSHCVDLITKPGSLSSSCWCGISWHSKTTGRHAGDSMQTGYPLRISNQGALRSSLLSARTPISRCCPRNIYTGHAPLRAVYPRRTIFRETASIKWGRERVKCERGAKAKGHEGIRG